MAQKTFRCANCGYNPREPPISGSWYCPKCGKRMEIPQHRPRVSRKFYPKPKKIRRTRDQITTTIYDKLTYEKTSNLGFKEAYLNPKIAPILPRRRDKIKLFFKK